MGEGSGKARQSWGEVALGEGRPWAGRVLMKPQACLPRKGTKMV